MEYELNYIVGAPPMLHPTPYPPKNCKCQWQSWQPVGCYPRTNSVMDPIVKLSVLGISRTRSGIPHNPSCHPAGLHPRLCVTDQLKESAATRAMSGWRASVRSVHVKSSQTPNSGHLVIQLHRLTRSRTPPPPPRCGRWRGGG